MGRKMKMTVSEAAWSCEMYGDAQMDALLDAAGWEGFGVYFFLCNRALSTDGYFLRFGEGDVPSLARIMGGGMTAARLSAIVGAIVTSGLFDESLAEEGVLTGAQLQRKWLGASGRRSLRTVRGSLWLLQPEESCGVIVAPDECCGAGSGNGNAISVCKNAISVCKNKVDADENPITAGTNPISVYNNPVSAYEKPISVYKKTVYEYGDASGNDNPYSSSLTPIGYIYNNIPRGNIYNRKPIGIPNGFERNVDRPSVGQHKERSAENAGFCDRPTDEDVRRYGAGLRAEAASVDAFLEVMSRSGWTDSAGRPVANWQAMLRKWTERRRAPAPSDAPARESDADAAYYAKLRAIAQAECVG